MTYLHSLLLGLMQGLTEFFPVSSSAHLKMLKLLVGIDDGSSHLLDLSCHLGTLVAAIYFLKEEIWQILSRDRKKMAHLFIAMLPLIPAYMLLKPLRDALSDSRYLGYCLMGTSIILLVGSYVKITRKKGPSPLKDMLCIGAMQSIALIPGISRSASTISCAKALGYSAGDAVRLSFLLSIPTILGGSCLEIAKQWLSSKEHYTHPLPMYFICFTAALITGLFMVKIAMKILTQDKLKPFSVYCFLAGLVMWAWLGRG